MALVGEGSLLILVVLGMIAFFSKAEDGSLTLSFPPPSLLLIMAVGALLIAGAVGIWLRAHRSPRVRRVSAILAVTALLTNVVVVAVSVTDNPGMTIAVAGIALALQIVEWWLARHDRVGSALTSPAV